MIWLVIVLFLAFVVWGVIQKIRNREGRSREGEEAAIILGLIFTLVFSIWLGLWTMQNGAGLMKWQAFYEANSINYAITVDETASYLSAEKYIDYEALIPIEGSLEKIRLASVVSDRIVEWRDSVNEYNRTIASMKYFNRIILTGIMVPDGVEDMKLLIIR